MMDRPGEPPLRVLLVVEPGLDGVFRFVEQLSRFLLARPDVEAHLAYSSVRGSPELHELVRLFESHGARTLDLRTSNAPRAGDLSAFLRLRRLAAVVRPDVIHAHSSKAGVLARALAWTGVRARYFYTPHAYYQMHGPLDLKKRFFMAVERLFARTGTTLNVSASEADYARRELGLSPDRQQIICNGVDCERFRPAANPAEKHALRRHFGLPPAACVQGTVARYSDQKDPLTLYRGVIAALVASPGLYFAHLGKGELMGETAALVRAAPAEVRARILQLESCDDLPGFYRMLDVFLLPSRYEGLALALLEAVATGSSLILTDCPGNTDLKPYGLDDVRWLPPGDAAQLAACMQAAAAAHGAPPNNHREIALKSFDLEAGHRDILRCYRATRA